MSGSEAEVCRLRSCGHLLYPFKNKELADCSHFLDKDQELRGGAGGGRKQQRSLILCIATFPCPLPHTHRDDLGKNHILTQEDPGSGLPRMRAHKVWDEAGMCF